MRIILHLLPCPLEEIRSSAQDMPADGCSPPTPPGLGCRYGHLLQWQVEQAKTGGLRYAIVRWQRVEEAQAAMEALNGQVRHLAAVMPRIQCCLGFVLHASSGLARWWEKLVFSDAHVCNKLHDSRQMRACKPGGGWHMQTPCISGTVFIQVQLYSLALQVEPLLGSVPLKMKYRETA